MQCFAGGLFLNARIWQEWKQICVTYFQNVGNMNINNTRYERVVYKKKKKKRVYPPELLDRAINKESK